MSRSTLIAIVLALAAIVNGALPAMAQDPKRQERTITLSATGSASAVPDFATIMVGVMTEGDTANVALAAARRAALAGAAVAAGAGALTVAGN